MSPALDILALQAIDDDMTSLQVSLAEVERRLGGDPELAEAREQLASTEAAVTGARAEQRRLDLDVKAFDEKIAREEGKLYDGSVKNPKELQSLQKEVDSLKTLRGSVEERLLTAIDNFDTLDSQRAERFKRLAAMEGRWLQDSATLKAESKALNARLKAIETRRAAEAAAIPPRALALYENLRGRKGGKAAARMAGGICQGCRVTIPDALRRRAMSSADLVQCPNCERILVAA